MFRLSEENKKLFKRLLYWLKIPITVGLCGLILANADWEHIFLSIQKANIWFILTALLVSLLNIVVTAIKWKMLLDIHGIRYPLQQLTAYYFTAGFFSNFLPGTIGGDGYRIYKTSRNSNSTMGAVLAVFTERIFGFMVLLFLGLCGAVGSYLLIGDKFSLFGIIFGLAGLMAFTIPVAVLSLERIQVWALKRESIPQKIKIFVKHMDDYRHRPTQFLRFIYVSIVFHLVIFLLWQLLICAFGESSSFFSLAMVVMVSTVLAALPISLNGIGILDGSFIFLISQYGVTYEVALMTVVLHRMLTMVGSMIGGGLYYLDRHTKDPAGQIREGILSIRESDL
jgi:hypothetical protein